MIAKIYLSHDPETIPEKIPLHRLQEIEGAHILPVDSTKMQITLYLPNDGGKITYAGVCMLERLSNGYRIFLKTVAQIVRIDIVSSL